MQENNENQSLSFEHRIDLAPLHNSLSSLKKEIGKIIVGQESVIDLILTALLANGHILLQGVPGVAKTLIAKLLAKTLEMDFSRIQFTPDLMPSDVLGTSIYNAQTSEFEFKKGPIFSNFVLIDEINRAPAKTQAALFEVMEERQITIDGHAYKMNLPFLVIGTQNPIEHEGTYRLPEAQLDRFLFLINIGYPSTEEEVAIISREHNQSVKEKLEEVKTHISANELINYQSLVRKVIVEPHLLQYIANIIAATRTSPFLYLGGSPRASIALLNTSKAYAAIQGRDFVTPEDIKTIAHAVLNHRIIVQPEKEMEGTTSKLIIDQILNTIAIPG